MTSSTIVQLRDVTKKIGSKTIVDRLSLEVHQGEVFGLLGPNGAGKTTTIRMMVGLISMTEGEILICGHSIARRFEQAIGHVGAIVENPEMYKFLSGYENLRHYARMMPGVTRERMEEIIKLVGLENRIFDKVKTYSLGMRQRLGVAQAVLHRPALLILDEPTNGLDPAGIRELRGYLRKLAEKEGVAVIVSSHLLTEMELMCDRVAILQKGKLVDVRAVRNRDDDSDSEYGTVGFEVDRPEQALALLQGLPEGTEAVSRPHGVELRAARERIAEINALLVNAGIKVYGIKPSGKTLEDTFLEMTGGQGID